MAGNDTFRTHRKASIFTMVQNELINNFELSWAAKGMLICLLSKPDGWKVYTSDIVKHATNGKDSVKSLTKELRAAGYITLIRIVNAKPRVQEWRYDVYDEPIECPVESYLTVRLSDNIEDMAAYPDLYECQDIDSTLEAQHDGDFPASIPEAGFPDVENPDSGKSPTSNIDSANTQSVPANAGKIDGVVGVEKEYGDIIETTKQQSFSTLDSPHDNAVAETFFSSFKKEETYRHRYQTQEELEASVAEYIEFYDFDRPH